MISQMPMLRYAQIDRGGWRFQERRPQADGGAGGSRRITRIIGSSSPARTFTAQDKLRILAETDRAAVRPAGSAPSCVARAFTPRPSPTGAGSAMRGRSAH